MKKDYLPVNLDDRDAAELALVEKHWTAIWQEQPKEWATQIARVARREEYRIMAPYLDQLRTRARVLDGGCGLGEWTVFLSERGYELYSVDIARRTLALLRQQFPQQRFLCADIRQLCFSTAFFDAYFSWGVFEHFEEGLGNCIAEARRVLRPGGHLFMSVPFYNRRHIWRDARAPLCQNATNDPQREHGKTMRFYQWRLTVTELERELASRGFRVREVRPISLREGVSRTLSHDLGLASGSLVHNVATRGLSWLAPSHWFSHMIMAVAERSAAVH